MMRLLQFMCLRFPTRVLDISPFRFKWLPVDFGYFSFLISYGSLVSSSCHYVCIGSCWFFFLSPVVLNLLTRVWQPLQSVWLTSLWATRLTWISLPHREQGGIFILQIVQTDLYSTVAGEVGRFPGGKAAGTWSWSFLHNVDVKNTSIPHTSSWWGAWY